MKLTENLAYGFTGFSISQFFGLLASGITFNQAWIVLVVGLFICLIPGFLAWGGLQNKVITALSRQQILSCFMPSMIGCAILLIGFLFGYISGV